MRTVLAVVLMLVSAVLACLGVAGAFVDGLARTPDPARELAGPLARDPALAAALAPRLVATMTERIPSQIAVPSAVEPLLERAAVDAVDAVLRDPGFEEAWLETIDLTREGYVARLGMVQDGAADSASVALELEPLASLGYARLKEAANALGLGALAEGLQAESAVSVDLGVHAEGDPSQGAIAEGVAQAGLWGWYAAGAVAAGLFALALAGPGTRWLVFAFGGAVAAGLGVAARQWAAGVAAHGTAGIDGAVPGGDALVQLVGDTLVSGLGRQLLPWSEGTLAAGAAVVVVSMVIYALSRRRTTR